MTPQERHERLQRLFLAARQLPPEARPAMLTQATSDDAQLVDEVLRLIAADESETPLLEQPLVDAGAAVDSILQETDSDDLELNAEGYQTLERLGQGDFAVVCKAQQLRPVQRIVAIKMLRSGLGQTNVMARFESERQALAMMDHPSIAKLFSASVSLKGRPYFVMEFVDGPRITKYCVAHDLHVRARLQLFLQVCGAVHHAHQRGVIHRDLKPSNILVDTADGAALPKIIDFGVAKAIAGSLLPSSHRTAQGQFIGTPAYMSPEQLHGAVGNVDVRSDVYALGMVLYEMLSGKLPHAVAGLPLAEVIRVRQAPPTLLSHWDRSLRGDLQTIVSKATATEPPMRYQSVAELQEDIQRFLDGRPVQARRPTIRYRVSKFVIRHKAIAGSLVAVLLIALFAGVQTYRAWRETQRQYAFMRDSAEHWLDEVVRTLAEAPGQTQVRRAVLQRVLDDTKELLRQRPQDPKILAIRAQALNRIGDIEGEQGDVVNAAAHQREALEINQGLSSRFPDDAETQERLSINLVKIGDLVKRANDFKTAQEWYRRAFAIDEQLVSRFPENLHLQDNLCWSYERLGFLAQILGDWKTAEEHYRKQLELAATLDGSSPHTAAFLYALCAAHNQLCGIADHRCDDEAHEHHSRAWMAAAEELVALAPLNRTYRLSLAHAIRNVSGDAVNQRRFAEAIALNQRSLDIVRELAASDPSHLAARLELVDALNSMAANAREAGDLKLAEQAATEAVHEAQALVAAQPLERVFANNLIWACEVLCPTLVEQGDVDRARPVGRLMIDAARAFAERSDALPADLRTYARSLLWVAVTDLRDPVTGLRYVQKAVELTNGKDPRLLLDLAQAQYLNGHSDLAVATVSQALELVPDDHSSFRRQLERERERFQAQATTQAHTGS